MAAPKGTRPPNAGKGRPKGAPNKLTTDVREAIKMLAENNITKLDLWLTRVSKRTPAKAADILLRTLEYHIPKLGRSEITGKNGEPVEVRSNALGLDLIPGENPLVVRKAREVLFLVASLKHIEQCEPDVMKLAAKLLKQTGTGTGNSS